VPPTQDGGTGQVSVVGQVYDAPTPSLLVWVQAAKEGPCALWTPRVPFCSKSCGGSAVCVEDERCQAYPSGRSVGTVTVTGLRTTSSTTTFTMDPVAGNYQPSETMAYPAFQEGDEIRFAASGGDFAPFTLTSTGIQALALTNGTISLADDQPIALTWTAPGKTGISRIHVKLDLSHHGGIKGKIECDADDSGSLQISALLVTQLMNLGVAGFPSIAVSRRAVGSTVIEVYSDVERQVQIPGVTSCNKDSDCPKDQSCQTDLRCK
jgi:hypothetical protein